MFGPFWIFFDGIKIETRCGVSSGIVIPWEHLATAGGVWSHVDRLGESHFEIGQNFLECIFDPRVDLVVGGGDWL
jgi:hypothetical protein